MGTVRDIVNTADNSSDVTADVKETLAMLESLANAKADAYEKTFTAALEEGKFEGAISLNIACTKILAQKREIRAITQDSSSVADNVKTSLSSIFSGDGKILQSLSDILTTAFTAIIGAGEGQESETVISMVLAEYPAIVRYDFGLWGRNVQADSIKSHIENVCVCIAYKSAVDMSKLDFNSFLGVYQPILTAAYGDDKTKINEMIADAKNLFQLFSSLGAQPMPSADEIAPPPEDSSSGRPNKAAVYHSFTGRD